MPSRLGDRSAIPSGYIGGLDTYRTIAVAAVVVHHYVPKSSGVHRVMPLGWFGVQAFFVLSAFLITRILLVEREALQGAGSIPDHGKRRDAFTRFYARRTLRIFPLYYGYLFGLFVLALFFNVGSVGRSIGWNLLYLQNFSAMWTDGPSFTGHLWTLAIEEQFYLVWPFVMLLVPHEWLGRVAGLAIGVGVASRVGLLLADVAPGDAQRITFARLDAFGAGALLAMWTAPGKLTVRRRTLVVASGALGAVALGGFALRKLIGPFSRVGGRTFAEEAAFVWVGLAGAAFFTFVIFAIASGMVPRPVQRLLEFRPLRYIGSISYGIYVWHILAPALWREGWSLLTGGAAEYDHIGGLGLTLIISALSWRFFESPINSLKSRFPSAQPAVFPDQAASPAASAQ